MTTNASPEMEVHSVEHKRKQILDDDLCDIGKKIDFDFESSSDFAWSDDGSERGRFCLSDIHDSVAALREEASTLDAILAVDQINSLRTEVATLQRELAVKNEELDEMRELVSLKDAIIGTLELECDLYKADFCNQVELKESISTIMTFESNSDQDQASTEETDEHQPSRTDIVSDLPTDVTPSTCTESSSSDSSNANVAECIQFFPRQAVRQVVDPPSCGSSIQSSCSETTEESIVQPSHGLMHPRSLLLSAHTKSGNANTPNMRALTPQRRSRGRTFQCCFGSGSKSRWHHKAVTSKAELDLEPCELYLQMEQMSHRMNSAVATADELRRRLAMLNRYYESSMDAIRKELLEAKSSRDKVEYDLSRQIAVMDRERRQALEKAEAIVQQKRKEKKPKVKAPQIGMV